MKRRILDPSLSLRMARLTVTCYLLLVTQPMYDVITIGDIKLDTFVLLDQASAHCTIKMPECLLCLDYGKKIPVGDIKSQVAGSAPNVAVGLARMKFHTATFSVMGKDYTHKIALERLRQEGVDTRYIKAYPHAESSYSVVLTYQGEKTILASHKPYVYHLPKLGEAKWFYVCEVGTGYVPLYTALTKYLPINHTQLAMNPGAVQIQERKKVLYEVMKKTSLLFLNLGEAKSLTRLEGSTKVRQIIAAAWRLNRKTVVITDGKAGAYGFDGKTIYFTPVFPGKRVEATGAGDSFATGVLGATMKNLPLDEALKWGAVNAASVVSKVGPQAGLLSAQEIRKRLHSHPSFKVSVM